MIPEVVWFFYIGGGRWLRKIAFLVYVKELLSSLGFCTLIHTGVFTTIPLTVPGKMLQSIRICCAVGGSQICNLLPYFI